MSHLLEEDLLAAAHGRRLQPAAGEHIAGCDRCRSEASAWRRLSRAATQADQLVTGPVEPPSFDSLLSGRLGTAKRSRAGQAARSIRLSVALVGSQSRLLPRALGPFTLAGFAAAVTAAVVTPEPAWGARFFSAMVVAFVLIGVLASGTARNDPRRELLSCLPVSPAAVFLARLTLVLTLELIAAAAASVLAVLVGQGLGFQALLLSWFGPSLLASSIAVVIAVAGKPWLGTVVGTALWFFGSITALTPSGGMHVGVGAIAASVWTTNVWTVVSAVVLLGVAVGVVARSAPVAHTR